MSVDLASSVPLEEFLSHVPAFIAKLWIMVEDHETDDIISWSNQGRAFTVHDQATLAKELLPKYFKHGNVQSFVRQLNMYNFHKQVSLTSALTEESPTFYHPCFLRDGPGLLVEIRRKVPRNSRVESAPSPDCGNAIVTSQLLKSRSRNLLDEFRELKRARKAVKRGLAELHGWLANGGTPIDNGVKQTGTVTSEETAVDDPHDVRMIDLSKTQSGDQPGAAQVVAESTRALQEAGRRLARQHRLSTMRLHVALESRRRLAGLEREAWEVRRQAAEQELANRQLEHAVLGQELAYLRARNSRVS
ncbi:heat shock factor protein-like isoform X3 [Bacillus rossius redtenbacheri]|uniref:heat shock factor protein-like isoform X3 n=1 Tax=Bacillus rossius redtenbacheri TaxID=93214 RepID=UPI002FDDA142